MSLKWCGGISDIPRVVRTRPPRPERTGKARDRFRRSARHHRIACQRVGLRRASKYWLLVSPLDQAAQAMFQNGPSLDPSQPTILRRSARFERRTTSSRDGSCLAARVPGAAAHGGSPVAWSPRAPAFMAARRSRADLMVVAWPEKRHDLPPNL
jgi:hypothetical protein